MALIWVPYGAFSPGGSAYGEQSAEALNVLPLYGGLYPAREKSSAIATVVDGPMTGAFAHAFPTGIGSAAYAGDAVTLFTGSKTKLYSVASGGGFVDLSKGGAYAAAVGAEPSGWRFASFGNDVWGVNTSDIAQRRTNNTGAFADGPVSTFKPSGRFIAPVREYMVIASLSNAGRSADEFVWSDANDATWYDDKTGSRPASLAGSKAIRSRPGQITGLTGGEYGVIYKRYSTYALQFTGGADIFRLDELSPGIGCYYPGSLIAARGADYFFGGDGFYRRSGLSAPEKISPPEIDQLFVDAARFNQRGFVHNAATTMAQEDDFLSGFEDRRTGCLFWLYANTYSGTANAENVLVYNPAVDLWTRLFGFGAFDLVRGVGVPESGTGATDLNNLNVALFDWDGTQSHYCTFSGTTLSAQVRTGRIRPGLSEGASADQVISIEGALPVFTVPESDSTNVLSSAPSVPQASVTITMATEPYFEAASDADGTVVSPRSETYDRLDADFRGLFPFSIQGAWADILIVLPAGAAWRRIEGCWVNVRIVP